MISDEETGEYAFPERFRALPPGYKVFWLDSGHFLWELTTHANRNGGPCEGLISWDRYWVRRCAFAHYQKRLVEGDYALGLKAYSQVTE